MEIRPDSLNEAQFLPSSGSIDTTICMNHVDANKMYGDKILTAITRECCEQYWTSPVDSIQQNSNCTATYNPSRKLSQLDEPDMWDTAGEVGTSS